MLCVPQESLGVVTAALKRAYDFRLEALRVRKMDRKRLQYECSTFTINFLADHFIIPADANIAELKSRINQIESDIKTLRSRKHRKRKNVSRAIRAEGILTEKRAELAMELEFLKRYEYLLQAVVNMNKLDLDWWLQKGKEAVPDTTAAVVTAWNRRVSNEHNQRASRYSTLCAETGLEDVAGALAMKRFSPLGSCAGM